MGQLFLELPLAAFQPGLCHPHLFDALHGLKAHEYQMINELVAPNEPFSTAKQIHICSTWPVHGQTWTAGKSLFAADDAEVLYSRMLWCFWLYNASRLVPSVQFSKLQDSVIFGKWTLKKCSNKMSACAKRIFGADVEIKTLVSKTPLVSSTDGFGNLVISVSGVPCFDKSPLSQMYL